MRAGADVIFQQDRIEAGGDRDDHVGLLQPLKLHRLERQPRLGRDLLQVRQHLGVIVPTDDFLETPLFQRRAQLKLRLMTRADHAHDLRILARQVVDRDRGGGGGAQGGREIAADHGADHAGIGVEQEHGGLVVDDAVFLQVVRPIAARLEAKRAAHAVEPALEAVERIFMANGLAHHGEVVGIARGHGGEDIGHRLVGGFARQQGGDFTFWNDDHVCNPS